MTEGQGWWLIGLLMALCVGAGFVLVGIEDIQTTIRLADVACAS